ncbi:hypothetical protein AXW81_22030 [Aeromonas salmonicida subsp. salmonicida]|uniref:hypothetical protein n=1 Tax=Aeromonas salmonicida TaxID=645 RepID=UPI0007C6EDB4|nr:hypothetical protein [Aeromonas salmonicida]OAH81657.1 hypothetical protein AXW81_22030 [Aeromonas salmonicida subsp. salmonicida]
MSHKQLVLQPGKRVSYQGRSFRIVKLLSLQLAELIAEDNHEVINACITKLQAPEAEVIKRPELTLIDDNAWEIARARMSIIMNRPWSSRHSVAEK